MEKLTSLNLSFDRVVIQLIIPGMIACYPFFILYFHFIPEAFKILLEDEVLSFILVFTFVSLVLGIIIENLGSRIEVRFYDRKQNIPGSDYMKIWDKYLTLAYDPEPIGQHYLRNILFRMKLELSIGISLIIMVIGLGIYNYYSTIFYSFWQNLLVIYLLPLSTAIYLLVSEGFASSKVLHNTRKLLVEKYYKS